MAVLLALNMMIHGPKKENTSSKMYVAFIRCVSK